jgi:hypothetical protein
MDEALNEARERLHRWSGQVGIQNRWHGPDAAVTINARREWAAARLEVEIRTVLAAAPPLTGEQLTRLRDQVLGIPVAVPER